MAARRAGAFSLAAASSASLQSQQRDDPRWLKEKILMKWHSELTYIAVAPPILAG